MRPDYARFAELANEGARELGFKDLGAMWRSGYDMPADEFAKRSRAALGAGEAALRGPALLRARQLAAKYGEDKVPAGKPIPAHLFGNMWAQQWDALRRHPRALPGRRAELDVDAALVAQKYDAGAMVKSAEAFYTSIGIPALPADVLGALDAARSRVIATCVCHASAWHMDGKDDVRIKMCITPDRGGTAAPSITSSGMSITTSAYKDQPFLFQNGAHDGFHEAIGDTVTLSMTPAYLAKIGLVPRRRQPSTRSRHQPADEDGARQDRLPAVRQADRPVALGACSRARSSPRTTTRPGGSCARSTRASRPPVERTEDDFDPGAKYHVPGNTPYTRYFLSFILQFQFQRALCEAAGYKGPL